MNAYQSKEPHTSSLVDGKGRENIGEKVITQSEWLYFDDRPVGLNIDDLIWQGDNLVQMQLEDIARQLIKPLDIKAKKSPGMTFAVLGDWGAGKSSFLKMLQDKAKEMAGDQQERLKFCEYVASAYANMDVDVRLTLGIRILRTLAGDDGKEDGVLLERLSEIYEHIIEEQVKAAQRDIPKNLSLMKGLQEIAAEVTGLIEFPTHLDKLLTGVEVSGFQTKVLVIMIDDLDRCPLNVVERILKTTQEWANVDNLFFVLAINRDWLRKAIQVLGGLEAESEDYALEKYVQHSVILPVLEGERLESYVKELLKGFDDPVSQTVAQHVVFLQKGLRFKTPRAVKRLLNSIRPRLKSALEAHVGNVDPRAIVKEQAANVDPRLIIKELVLEYSWPEFFQNYYIRSVKGARRGFARAWEQLEAACRAYEVEANRDQTDPDDERLEFSIQRIRQQYRDNHFMNPISPPLVYFLAEEPYWFYRPSPEADEDYVASIPTKAPDTEFEFEVGPIYQEHDMDSQFMQLYYAGRSEQEPQKSLQLYAQAAELATRTVIVSPAIVPMK